MALGLTYVAWMIFLVVWTATAIHTKAWLFRESVPQAISYRIFAVVGFLLLVYSDRMGTPFSTLLVKRSTLVSGLAVAICFGGLAVCLLARFALGTNWSSAVVLKEDHELVQSGPYRFVRHPIYAGILLMVLSDVLLGGRIGSILAFPLFVASFILKLSREEKVMTIRFPSSYQNYSRRVKRLIPFVY